MASPQSPSPGQPSPGPGTTATTAPPATTTSPATAPSTSTQPHSVFSGLPTTTGPTAADLLLDYLALEGVDTIFGIPGGAVIGIMTALRKRGDKFRFVVCRQESGAAYAADGYTRATGRLGVVLTTSGPGALNAVTGTANAHCSHSPLLVITGEQQQALIGRGYLQEGYGAEIDLPAVYESITRYSAICTDTQNFQRQLEHAIRMALTVPRGASHLLVPDDVGSGPLPAGVVAPASPDAYRARAEMAFSPKDAEAILKQLVKADHPVMFLGNGCRRALIHPRAGDDTRRPERLAAMVDKFAIPVMTTPDAKGIFPESHAMSLRHYGKASSLWAVAYLGDPNGVEGESRCDAMLVLASSLHQLATEGFNPALQPNGPLIQVDLDADVVGRGYPITKGIVTDVSSVIDTLCEVGDSWQLTPEEIEVIETRRGVIKQIRATDPFRDPQIINEGAAVPAKPQALTTAINELLPPGSHVYIDGGNCIGWSLHYMTIDPPNYPTGAGASSCELHNSLVLGPMGSGTAAVVGGKIARPDLTCVSFTGDGGFMTQGNEISAAAAHGAGAIWIVLNDNSLGMVAQGMYVFSGMSSGTPDPGWENYYQLGSPNLVKFAEGLGAHAVEVYSADEFRKAFAAALERSGKGRPSPQDGTKFNLGGTPQVIIVHIDPTEIPPFYPPSVTPPNH